MTAPCDFECHQTLVENIQIQTAGFDIGSDKCGMEISFAISGANIDTVERAKLIEKEVRTIN